MSALQIERVIEVPVYADIEGFPTPEQVSALKAEGFSVSHATRYAPGFSVSLAQPGAGTVSVRWLSDAQVAALVLALAKATGEAS